MQWIPTEDRYSGFGGIRDQGFGIGVKESSTCGDVLSMDALATASCEPEGFREI
jgi:hypothetical protein